MNTVKIEKKQTKMVAHRGVSGLERENTVMAFVAAGNRSYYGIETDIHTTADGNFIVIHDSSTKRVSGEEYCAEETDFETLRRIELLDLDGVTKRPDLHLPTLEEYLRTCKKYEKTAVLELKNPMAEEAIGRLIERIRGEEYLEHVVFISFTFENLVAVRKFSEDQPVQFLFKSFTPEILEAVKAHRFDVDVHYAALTEEIVRDLHACGIEVNCWTVNDAAVGEKLASWGVDYITTNILE